jgi:methylmalonyl-CoA/ethylmalonyl-CoA epimerase
MNKPIIPDALPHHFSISVPDMDEAIRFWTEIFGATTDIRFRVEAIGGNGAFLSIGALKLELWELSGAKPVPEERKTPNADLMTNGTKHMAFSVPDLQSTIEALHRKGVKIAAVQRDRSLPMRAEEDPSLAFDPMRKPAFAAFICDPAGSLIELLNRPNL